jgi:hypothetical protein
MAPFSAGAVSSGGRAPNPPGRCALLDSRLPTQVNQRGGALSSKHDRAAPLALVISSAKSNRIRDINAAPNRCSSFRNP